jgi:hypothetical protein
LLFAGPGGLRLIEGKNMANSTRGQEPYSPSKADDAMDWEPNLTGVPRLFNEDQNVNNPPPSSQPKDKGVPEDNDKVPDNDKDRKKEGEEESDGDEDKKKEESEESEGEEQGEEGKSSSNSSSDSSDGEGEDSSRGDSENSGRQEDGVGAKEKVSKEDLAERTRKYLEKIRLHNVREIGERRD